MDNLKEFNCIPCKLNEVCGQILDPERPLCSGQGLENQLLQSAYAIAQRRGKETNWEAFENNLRKELLKQAGVPDNTDEQIILRATCTAKTYRMRPDEDDLP